MKAGRRRVLFVGIEAADAGLLQQWMAAGELPNLSALAARGVQGPLPAEAEFMSEGTWQTALTGRGVGGHGLYNWRVVPAGRDQRVALERGSYSLPFWRVLREHGPAEQGDTILLDVPYLDPVDPAGGGDPDPGVRQIVGWGMRGHRTLHVHPPELADRIDHGARPPDWIDRERRRGLPAEARYAATLRRNARARCDLALGMLADGGWTLAGIDFVETHRAGHAFFHGPTGTHWAHSRLRGGRTTAAMLSVYRAVDENLGRLVEAVGPDTDVFVLSTFSMRPNETAPELLTSAMTALGYHVPNVPDRRTRRRLLARRAAMSLVPGFLRHRIRRRVSEEMITEISQEAWTATIDWQRSRVVSESEQGSGWIRINLAGREPNGIVPPAEREALLEELRRELVQLTDADSGEPVVRDVVRVEEIAPGPRARHLPDLILLWTPGRHRRLRHPRTGLIKPGRETIVPSEHLGLGTLVAAGPRVERGAVEGRLVDFAPTLLHLLGAPVPEDMDGSVLGSILRDAGPETRAAIPLERDALA